MTESKELIFLIPNSTIRRASLSYVGMADALKVQSFCYSDLSTSEFAGASYTLTVEVISFVAEQTAQLGGDRRAPAVSSS